MSILGAIAGGLTHAAVSTIKKTQSSGSYSSAIKNQANSFSNAINKVNQAFGGGKGSSSYVQEYNPYDDYIRQQQEMYAEMQRQQEAARRAAINQGVQRLEANRGVINQGYDDAARQAYIQKMQERQNLPQMLAGQGASGGATESANIALDTAYGNNINQNETARQDSLNGLNQSISDLKSSGDISIADSNLALQQQQLADYSNAYANKIAQDNWLKQYQQSVADSSKADFMNTIGAYADDYAAEINRLKAMGVSEDDYRIKALKAARVDKLTEMQLAAAAAAQQQFDNDYKTQQLYNDTRRTDWSVAKPYYKATSSKGSGMTISQALRMMEMGRATPEVLRVLGIK